MRDVLFSNEFAGDTWWEYTLTTFFKRHYVPSVEVARAVIFSQHSYVGPADRERKVCFRLMSNS
jgi:hypothetical protein